MTFWIDKVKDITELLWQRMRYSYALWDEDLWERWIFGLYAIASFFIFLRDEFWRPLDESKWKIINFIPHLTLAWWLFGIAVILIVWIFEIKGAWFGLNSILQRAQKYLR